MRIRGSVVLILLMATTVLGMMVIVMLTGDHKIHNNFHWPYSGVHVIRG